MSGRDNVNAEQFSLLGPPEPVEGAPEPERATTPQQTRKAEYGNTPKNLEGLVENPLYDENVRINAGSHSRAWVPTDSLTSQQDGVFQPNVDNLASNYDQHPAIYADATSDGRWSVGDGNHRANAAQQRGQLFVSALTNDYQYRDDKVLGRSAPPTLGYADKAPVDNY